MNSHTAFAVRALFPCVQGLSIVDPNANHSAGIFLKAQSRSMQTLQSFHRLLEHVWRYSTFYRELDQHHGMREPDLPHVKVQDLPLQVFKYRPVRRFLEGSPVILRDPKIVARIALAGHQPAAYPGRVVIFQVEQSPWYVTWNPIAA